MIIEKILGNIDEFDEGGRSIDMALLTHEELNKTHQKIFTQNGTELYISLERGAKISCGAVLYEDEEQIIVVDMQIEKVFEIKPKSSQEWAIAAFNIGNMHQNAFIYPDCIRVPYDYVLENMISSLNIPYEIAERKLDGIRPNVSHGHHH